MQSVVQLREQFGPLVGFDDWLDGWSLGALRKLVEDHSPRSIHAEGFPANERFGKLWLDLSNKTSSGAAVSATFDMAIVAQMAHERDLVLDPDRPFAFIERLNRAAARVRPGGCLAWCQYLAMPADDDDLAEPIETAAAFQSFGYRGFTSLAGGHAGIGRIAIYNDPRTIYVSQQATLATWPRHRRITKVLCALRRSG
jgi:hypothetical protein